MLPTFPWQFDKSSTNTTKLFLGYLAVTLVTVSGCANITIQPKDPELIALGNFADQATLHLFEVNPSTYEEYQGALEHDIAPNILTQLKSRGSSAKSKAQAKQTVQAMEKNNQRCLVRIESTTFPGKATAQGLIPIEVRGTFVKTANDISKASTFDVIYLVGNDPKTKKPLIGSIQIKKFD